MTVKQAYIFGFLTRCAEEGLAMPDIVHRIKRANSLTKSGVVSEALGAMKSLGSGAASLAGSYALPLAIAAPLAVGGGAGLLASRVTDDHFDESDARAKEQIAEYRRALAEITRASKLRNESQMA